MECDGETRSGRVGEGNTCSSQRMSCCSDSGRSSLKVSGTTGTRMNNTDRLGCIRFNSRSSVSSCKQTEMHITLNRNNFQ